MGESTASRIIAVVLSNSRGAVQVVDSSQESINALASVILGLENFIDQARRVDQEFLLVLGVTTELLDGLGEGLQEEIKQFLL